jgi:beta-phosphoglucomutase
MLKKVLAELVFFMDRLLHRKQIRALSVRPSSNERTQRIFKLGSFKGFIFDMDGLVLDTEPTYFAAWQRAAELMGYQLEPNSFKRLSGSTYSEVEKQLKTLLGDGFNLQDFKQAGTKYWRKHVREHGIAIKPGVTDLLDYALQQGIPVCLATNSWAVYAKHCLAIAGLTYRFPLMVTGDDVEHVKPAPDIFLKAAELMSLDIKQCVIFEDSHTGILAASASGAYTVYVPSIFPVNPQTVALCDCMLDDLTQVFETLPVQTTFGI